MCVICHGTLLLRVCCFIIFQTCEASKFNVSTFQGRFSWKGFMCVFPLNFYLCVSVVCYLHVRTDHVALCHIMLLLRVCWFSIFQILRLPNQIVSTLSGSFTWKGVICMFSVMFYLRFPVVCVICMFRKYYVDSWHLSCFVAVHPRMLFSHIVDF